jgi:hypothetical protein
MFVSEKNISGDSYTICMEEFTTKHDYESLAEIISKETGLDLSLEYHYKFLVLLPLDADEKLENKIGNSLIKAYTIHCRFSIEY